LLAAFVWTGAYYAASSPKLNDNASLLTVEAKEQSNQDETEVFDETTTSQCKCYCAGKSWSPGATACMGGFKHRCVARPTGIPGVSGGCGWDPVKKGKDQVHCDGGENCK
jgi:hypothetical protein